MWLCIGALALQAMAGLAAQVLLIPVPEDGGPIILGPVVFCLPFFGLPLPD
ncbi:hypothetical protein KIH13_16785 [Pseudomonas viridiflava]|nr:hypothetical protein KIH13_16785 [Pseudomonas viridiflava]